MRLTPSICLPQTRATGYAFPATPAGSRQPSQGILGWRHGMAVLETNRSMQTACRGRIVFHPLRCVLRNDGTVTDCVWCGATASLQYYIIAFNGTRSRLLRLRDEAAGALWVWKPKRLSGFQSKGAFAPWLVFLCRVGWRHLLLPMEVGAVPLRCWRMSSKAHRKSPDLAGKAVRSQF